MKYIVLIALILGCATTLAQAKLGGEGSRGLLGKRTDEGRQLWGWKKKKKGLSVTEQAARFASAAAVTVGHDAYEGRLGGGQVLSGSDDKVFSGKFHGMDVVFFDGTSSLEGWVSNVVSYVGSFATSSDRQMGRMFDPIVSKVSGVPKHNNVICAGHSRGVWMVNRYAEMCPNCCGSVVMVGAPGDAADNRQEAWVVTVGSNWDPVDWLGSEDEHYQKTVSATHSMSSYKDAVMGWVGSGVKNMGDELRQRDFR